MPKIIGNCGDEVGNGSMINKMVHRLVNDNIATSSFLVTVTPMLVVIVIAGGL